MKEVDKKVLDDGIKGIEFAVILALESSECRDDFDLFTEALGDVLSEFDVLGIDSFNEIVNRVLFQKLTKA